MNDKPLRKSNLMVECLGDEALVYNHETHVACCLDPLCSQVFQMCDGEHDCEAMAAGLQGCSPDQDLRREAVAHSLSLLEENGLLEPCPAGFAAGRRDFLRKAAMLPVLLAISAPTPAMAASAAQGCVRYTECETGSNGTSCARCTFRADGDCLLDTVAAYCMATYAPTTASYLTDPQVPAFGFSCEPENGDGHWDRNCAAARAWIEAFQPVSNYKCCLR